MNMLKQKTNYLICDGDKWAMIAVCDKKLLVKKYVYLEW